jgi:polyphosphate kinase
LTRDAEITKAVHHVFNYLTAYSERSSYGPLSVAPLNLGKNCISLIEREAEHARAGRPALIVAKVNSLLDKQIIQALYRASRAGVHIELIVRGACALRPGVRGVSGRIRVFSVVGRFLEHSRVAVFANGGQAEVYLGSADWMPRNLYERVEVMFRLKDPGLCRRVCATILAPYLADTDKARLLQTDGQYVRMHDVGRPPGAINGRRFAVQDFLIDVAEGGKEADVAEVIARLPKRHSGALAGLLSLNWATESDAQEVPAPTQ